MILSNCKYCQVQASFSLSIGDGQRFLERIIQYVEGFRVGTRHEQALMLYLINCTPLAQQHAHDAHFAMLSVQLVSLHSKQAMDNLLEQWILGWIPLEIVATVTSSNEDDVISVPV